MNIFKKLLTFTFISALALTFYSNSFATKNKAVETRKNKVREKKEKNNKNLFKTAENMGNFDFLEKEKMFLGNKRKGDKEDLDIKAKNNFFLVSNFNYKNVNMNSDIQIDNLYEKDLNKKEKKNIEGVFTKKEDSLFNLAYEDKKKQNSIDFSFFKNKDNLKLDDIDSKEDNGLYNRLYVYKEGYEEGLKNSSIGQKEKGLNNRKFKISLDENSEEGLKNSSIGQKEKGLENKMSEDKKIEFDWPEIFNDILEKKFKEQFPTIEVESKIEFDDISSDKKKLNIYHDFLFSKCKRVDSSLQENRECVDFFVNELCKEKATIKRKNNQILKELRNEKENKGGAKSNLKYRESIDKIKNFINKYFSENNFINFFEYSYFKKGLKNLIFDMLTKNTTFFKKNTYNEKYYEKIISLEGKLINKNCNNDFKGKIIEKCNRMMNDFTNKVVDDIAEKIIDNNMKIYSNKFVEIKKDSSNLESEKTDFTTELVNILNEVFSNILDKQVDGEHYIENFLTDYLENEKIKQQITTQKKEDIKSFFKIQINNLIKNFKEGNTKKHLNMVLQHYICDTKLFDDALKNKNYKGICVDINYIKNNFENWFKDKHINLNFRYE